MSFADVLTLLAVAVAVLWAFLRYAPSDSHEWHVDPDTVRRPARPNHMLLRGEGVFLPVPPDQVAARLEAVARHTPRTAPFAGEGFHRTWITRSALLGLPTFTSVRLRPAEGGTRMTVFVRARFLPSLPAAERARAEGWIATLQSSLPAEGAPPAPSSLP
ncbi:DUF1499 domain-containing protein [Falsirhodobacter algicola]|uniref:DUF1499 domain-containing protein n=1 Tax=Falsirhodobacter algicola TaxID=2692330 RepID=A0A8J8MSF7_9RHOB|nr:DUF1499 domain-containing protein [Falsirhodobacter algicola]QUS35679.1 DUF1499 domain-containing protein [Falsirhodobacter algicola]